MAVLKIFPEKDATLYSLFPTMNTGLDEIVEATLTTFAYENPNPQASRFLIQFSNDDIASAIDLIPQTTYDSGSWKANLQCFIATSTGLNVTTTLDCYPAAIFWGMGTGRYLDDPISTDGCSWVWSTFAGNTLWTSSIPSGATASYTSSVPAGGGVWYTGSYYTASTTFNFRSDKDLNLDVTNTVEGWITGSLNNGNPFVNNGFLLKQRTEWVYNQNFQPELKYYSVDTNTIYPPALQISWNDFSWNTGSSKQTILNTTPATLTLAQNPGTFYPESINRFRINARPEYPLQIWETSSVYLNNDYLPSGSSYWALKDLDTNEYIINFDPQYTQISADVTSSYFDIHMNFLEPERYYAILIQTTLNGSTIVFDNQYYFKVING